MVFSVDNSDFKNFNVAQEKLYATTKVSSLGVTGISDLKLETNLWLNLSYDYFLNRKAE